MDTLILGAIPFFFLLMGIELVALHHAAHDHDDEPDGDFGRALCLDIV